MVVGKGAQHSSQEVRPYMASLRLSTEAY